MKGSTASDMTNHSVSAPGPWSILLTGSLSQQTLQTVETIADSIATLSPDEQDPSLAGGQAGLALLYAWLARTRGSARAEERAWRCLDRAIDAVATQEMESSLWHGFVGVAWAAEILQRLLDPQGEDRNEAVDDVVSRLLMRHDLWRAPHDLVDGVTGLGVYALERHPRPLAVECLRYIVERLEASAQHDDRGIYWWTPATELSPDDREEHPSGLVDLGVAHGVPGAIAVLGAICGIGVESPRAHQLLEGAVSWLRAQAVTTDTGPTYPYSVAPGAEPEPARSAWCYGDPGVAAALLVAARGAQQPAWERAAVELACRAAGRPPAETGIIDAGFCHGTAGLAHLYNRMYQATGEGKLGHAARYWLERTLQFCRLAQSRGGLWVKGTEDPSEGGWTDLDLMTGAAGIALVLLAATTSLEPLWDRMFLASSPRSSLLHAL
ncbi:MAG: lanthionine synthetase C family protein [Actinomycetota bacterium]|nr:lanthionine synthetase C family protein [Actinomycetota bacterium]